jgi:hypothetical protein
MTCARSASHLFSLPETRPAPAGATIVTFHEGGMAAGSPEAIKGWFQTDSSRFQRSRLRRATDCWTRGVGSPAGLTGFTACVSTLTRPHRMLTARAASRASTVSEMMDWSIISTLPHRANAGVSVGENAVLVLKARNK